MAFLTVGDLSINFGGLTALSGVGFEVARGEIFALIGPNGAGKTTVFNILTGLYRPTAGRALLDGVELTRLPPHEIVRQGVARTFQNTELFRRLTVRDNVLIGQHTQLEGGVLGGAFLLPEVRREEARARREAEGLLGRLGIEGYRDALTGTLPLGIQKRVELARALAARPRLLLLDEPGGGLNPTETQALMDLVRDLRDREELTLILVEHDMELVMGLSDRVAVLDYGRKIAEGKPAEVARDPAVIQAYLGSDGDRD